MECQTALRYSICLGCLHSAQLTQQLGLIFHCLFLRLCLNIHKQRAVSCSTAMSMFVFAETICYSVRRNAERCLCAWAWVQAKYLKSHSSLLLSSPLLHPLPNTDRGTSLSSYFLAVWGQQCMLADLPGTFSLHCKICWRPNWAQRLCAPALSNNELRRAIGTCLFDAADTVMPLCGVSKWNVCVLTCMWGKLSDCFGREIICKRTGSAAKKITKEILQRWVLHSPNLSSSNIMKRWPFYSLPASSQLFLWAERANGGLWMAHFSVVLKMKRQR